MTLYDVKPRKVGESMRAGFVTSSFQAAVKECRVTSCRKAGVTKEGVQLYAIGIAQK